MSGDKTVNVNDEKEFKNNSSDKCVGNENITKEEYNQYVENITPSFPLWKNMLKAFITGGLICLMGQVWIELFKYFGMDKEQAVNWTTVVLIAESVILTGLNIYPKIGKFGGAGAVRADYWICKWCGIIGNRIRCRRVRSLVLDVENIYYSRTGYSIRNF